MAVAAPQRVGQRAFLGGLLAATALMSLVVGTVVILGGGADCPAMGSTPTDQAKNSIPATALAIYQRAGQRYDVDWAFLASIGAQECDHGRCAGAQQINSSGCGGPMQIAMRRRSPCSSGAGPTLWERYRQDGDGDGHAERFDFADAVATAALVLRKAKGAPPTGGSAAGYRRTACAYYGACSDAAVAYADQVMARAAVYGFHAGQAAPPPRIANVPTTSTIAAVAASRAARAARWPTRCGAETATAGQSSASPLTCQRP